MHKHLLSLTHTHTAPHIKGDPRTIGPVPQRLHKSRNMRVLVQNLIPPHPEVIRELYPRNTSGRGPSPGRRSTRVRMDLLFYFLSSSSVRCCKRSFFTVTKGLSLHRPQICPRVARSQGFKVKTRLKVIKARSALCAAVCPSWCPDEGSTHRLWTFRLNRTHSAPSIILNHANA